MNKSKIKVLFTDLGGVLLTNGWGFQSREKAIQLFSLEGKDFESRHQMIFPDYEVGKISLDTYLDYAVFFTARAFTKEAFIDFMFSQSKAHEEALEMVKELKKKQGFKVVVISNEGKELTDYRIKKFNLSSFVDYFIVSCFIGIRKPDRNIYRIALDMVQVSPEETAYIEDRVVFVEIAKEFGIQAILHRDVKTTHSILEKLF